MIIFIFYNHTVRPAIAHIPAISMKSHYLLLKIGLLFFDFMQCLCNLISCVGHHGVSAVILLKELSERKGLVRFYGGMVW
jgi:hypothetical protein